MLRSEKFGEREPFELCLKRDDNKMLFLFRFIYLGGDGPLNAAQTSCTLIIHAVVSNYSGFVLATHGNAKRHPKDLPNWKIGARLSAKRAIYSIDDEALDLTGVSKNELYRSVREAIPVILEGHKLWGNPDPTNQP